MTSKSTVENFLKSSHDVIEKIDDRSTVLNDDRGVLLTANHLVRSLFADVERLTARYDNDIAFERNAVSVWRKLAEVLADETGWGDMLNNKYDAERIITEIEAGRTSTTDKLNFRFEEEFRGWREAVGMPDLTPVRLVKRADFSESYLLDQYSLWELDTGEYMLVLEEGCSCYLDRDAKIEFVPDEATGLNKFDAWVRGKERERHDEG